MGFLEHTVNVRYRTVWHTAPVYRARQLLTNVGLDGHIAASYRSNSPGFIWVPFPQLRGRWQLAGSLWRSLTTCVTRTREVSLSRNVRGPGL